MVDKYVEEIYQESLYYADKATDAHSRVLEHTQLKKFKMDLKKAIQQQIRQAQIDILKNLLLDLPFYETHKNNMVKGWLEHKINKLEEV